MAMPKNHNTAGGSLLSPNKPTKGVHSNKPMDTLLCPHQSLKMIGNS